MGARAGEHQRSLSFGAPSSNTNANANNINRSVTNNGSSNISNNYHNTSASSRSRQVNYIPSSPSSSPSPSSSQPPSPSTSSYVSAGGSRRSNINRSREENGVSARVRVAVRLRPRNAEELKNDADFADYVELIPELKRLKLKKNSWECDTFQFDEILNETASQKRVYEVVAKPVVESVLEGYNGTIMAYGQTGTGKTFTLGKIGDEDAADRGIMVRAMEQILADTSFDHDTVSVSYLQLYMETVQDLLAPEKDNIAIVEDANGDVSLPGATSFEIRNQKSFVELLQMGEANRFAANTKMNTESSRSHAILLVSVRKSVRARPESEPTNLNENGSMDLTRHSVSTIRRSKLLIVDLAGSERIDKSGCEGHVLEETKFINLSLTALGKCINALAENRQHVPIRDSKLTRILRDSFGGTARTSLIITIGPSPQHRGETSSTILFGQRAMKVENMVKLKEEFDYKSLCRKLETDLDRLIAENERQTKALSDIEEEMQKKIDDAQLLTEEAQKDLREAIEELAAERFRLQNETKGTVNKLEKECSKLRKELKESAQNIHTEKEAALMEKEMQIQNEKTRLQKEQEEFVQKYQLQLVEITKKLEAESLQKENLQRKIKSLEEDRLNEKGKFELEYKEQVMQLKLQIEKETKLRAEAERQLHEWKYQRPVAANEDSRLKDEVNQLRKSLDEQFKHREKLEDEVKMLKQQLLQISYDDETRRTLDRDLMMTSTNSESGMNLNISLNNPHHMREAINGQRATISRLFEHVGLHKILDLLDSEDMDVRLHAAKVVANLAAEEGNQEKIVESGGLSLLLNLLKSSRDETIRRVAVGAIANLAMNETNQQLIMAQNGIQLLAKTANEAGDLQTLRMVAGAIANLCGNDKLQVELREEGGIKALLSMTRSTHRDILAQIARGIANFAKCESRAIAQGQKFGKSLLIEDGALPWVVENSSSEISSVKRHLELALCHLGLHEENAKDLLVAGAVPKLVRISIESPREDIRNLARRTLTSPTFQS